MILTSHILGNMADPEMHDRVHRHEHAGTVEWIVLPREDLSRRRLRAVTDMGTEIAIALPRAVSMFDGAVVYEDATRLVTVRVDAETWLRLRPRGTPEALRLGYFAGNLHWRTRFDGADLLIAQERDPQTYLDRLSEMLESGAVCLVNDAAARAAS